MVSSSVSSEAELQNLHSSSVPLSPLGPWHGSPIPKTIAFGKRKAEDAFTNSAAKPATAEQPWQLWPSRVQVPVPPQKYTHTKEMPLPVSLDALINGVSCTAQYVGHGNSKVAYLLSAPYSKDLSGKVLKLCRHDDQEPRVFTQLSATCLYPQVHSMNRALVHSKDVKDVPRDVPNTGSWYAWIVEKATALDQFIKRKNVANSTCIKGAIRCMVHAACNGHYLSDNALFNFGVLRNEVVITDAGSRPIASDIWSRAVFNKRCMKKFWY